MADIAMCTNILCEKRATCYRYMAQPSDVQSYCEFNDGQKDGCGYYWELN